MSAKLSHGCLSGIASASGLVLEEHEERLVLEQMVAEPRAYCIMRSNATSHAVVEFPPEDPSLARGSLALHSGLPWKQASLANSDGAEWKQVPLLEITEAASSWRVGSHSSSGVESMLGCEAPHEATPYVEKTPPGNPGSLALGPRGRPHTGLTGGGPHPSTHCGKVFSDRLQPPSSWCPQTDLSVPTVVCGDPPTHPGIPRERSPSSHRP